MQAITVVWLLKSNICFVELFLIAYKITTENEVCAVGFSGNQSVWIHWTLIQNICVLFKKKEHGWLYSRKMKNLVLTSALLFYVVTYATGGKLIYCMCVVVTQMYTLDLLKFWYINLYNVLVWSQFIMEYS